MTTVWPEGLSQWKFPMTPSEIEHAAFRLAAQCLNQPRTPNIYNIVSQVSEYWVAWRSLHINGETLTELCWHSPYIYFFPLWRDSPPPPPVGYGLLIYEVSRSHTTTHHSRQDSSGWVISSSQRPLPDNTQHSRQTSMPPARFEPTISAGERTHTYALGRAATGTGRYIYWLSEMFEVSSFYTDTLSTSLRNICTSRLTKLPIFVDVTERFFDEKR